MIKQPKTRDKVYDLTGAILYSMDRTGYISVEVYGDFEDVKNRIKKEEWHLKKTINNGVVYRTGILTELWKEDNECHAITKNGTHYIF